MVFPNRPAGSGAEPNDPDPFSTSRRCWQGDLWADHVTPRHHTLILEPLHVAGDNLCRRHVEFLQMSLSPLALTNYFKKTNLCNRGCES